MKYIIILLSIIIISTNSWGQDHFYEVFMSNRQLARQFYQEKNYADAATYLLRIYKRNKLKDKDAPILADCLYRTQQKSLAMEIYQYMEAREINFDQQARTQYFITMLNNGAFEKAYQWYYEKDTVVDSSVFLDNINVGVEPVKEINSPQHEYGSTPFGTGFLYISTQPSYSVIATQNKEGEGFPQPFLATLAEDGSIADHEKYDFPFWPKASYAGFTLFDSGNKMILSAIPFTDKEKKYSLYFGEKNQTGQWELKHEIELGEGNFIQPFYFEKEDILYFVADLNEESGTDLYYCNLTNGMKVSSITRMGDHINTLGNELYPIIHQDSLLIFASNGHYGLGGFDLYQLNLKKPEEVKNLGPPLNSPYDDYSLIFFPYSRFGFFSSSRNEAGDDVFKFYHK